MHTPKINQLANCRTVKQRLESEIIGAVLGNQARLTLDFLRPAHFTFGGLGTLSKTPPLNSTIWKHILKLWPDQPIDRITLCHSLLTEDIDNPKEWEWHINSCTLELGQHIMASHALQLIELQVRLCLHTQLEQLRSAHLSKADAQAANVLKELRDFSVNLSNDFFEMLDDVQNWIGANEFEPEVLASLQGIMDLVPGSAGNIKKTSAFRHCVNNLLAYSDAEAYGGPLSERARLVKKLAWLMKVVLIDADMPADLPTQIMDIEIDGKR